MAKKAKDSDKTKYYIWALSIALVVTNLIWLQIFYAQSLTNKSNADFDFQVLKQIGELRYCIDENISPCETKNYTEYGE